VARIGSFLAGLWFIAQGVLALTGFRFHGSHILMAALAIVAGAFLLIRR